MERYDGVTKEELDYLYSSKSSLTFKTKIKVHKILIYGIYLALIVLLRSKM